MNTPTHLIIGAALCARRDRPGSLIAAFAGGLAPDVPILVMVLYATRIAGVPAHEVFGSLFHSESWQRVFAIDHSFAVWGGLLIAASLFRFPLLVAFSGSGLAHAVVDFFTHRTDARKQFWPLTDWVFRSPVSYWDAQYWGSVVAPIEALIVIVLTVVLVRRMDRWWQRLLTVGIALVFLVPIVATRGFHGLHGLG